MWKTNSIQGWGHSDQNQSVCAAFAGQQKDKRQRTRAGRREIPMRDWGISFTISAVKYWNRGPVKLWNSIPGVTQDSSRQCLGTWSKLALLGSRVGPEICTGPFPSKVILWFYSQFCSLMVYGSILKWITGIASKAEHQLSSPVHYHMQLNQEGKLNNVLCQHETLGGYYFS